jgi:hypothetical protein
LIRRTSSDRRAKVDRERERVAGALRMIEQRPQDRGGGCPAERAHKRPVILAGPPLPAAVAGGDLRGVVEKVWGLGQHEITLIVRRSIMAVQPNSMTSEVMVLR